MAKQLLKEKKRDGFGILSVKHWARFTSRVIRGEREKEKKRSERGGRKRAGRFRSSY